MPGFPEAPYTIACSQQELNKLKRWKERASTPAVRVELLEALQVIEYQLRTGPLIWGDPEYRLRTLGLVVYLGLKPPIQVYYAVDEARRVVHIKEFKVLSGHPLAE